MAILKSLNDGGQIEITVLEELPEFNNDVTDHPVEDGSSVSDHAALRPGEIPLSGVVAGEDAPGKIATLRRWRTERHLLKYTGRNILTNYVIQEFRTEHDAAVRDGFRFRLVLKQVRIVKPAIVELVRVDPVVAAPVAGAQAVSAQVKPEEPKGRQQIQTKLFTPALDLLREQPEITTEMRLHTPALDVLRNAAQQYNSGHPALGQVR